MGFLYITPSFSDNLTKPEPHTTLKKVEKKKLVKLEELLKFKQCSSKSSYVLGKVPKYILVLNSVMNNICDSCIETMCYKQQVPPNWCRVGRYTWQSDKMIMWSLTPAARLYQMLPSLASFKHQQDNECLKTWDEQVCICFAQHAIVYCRFCQSVLLSNSQANSSKWQKNLMKYNMSRH